MATSFTSRYGGVRRMESNSSQTAVVKEPAFPRHVREFFLLKKLRLFMPYCHFWRYRSCRGNSELTASHFSSLVHRAPFLESLSHCPLVRKFSFTPLHEGCGLMIESLGCFAEPILNSTPVGFANRQPSPLGASRRLLFW